MMRRDILGNEVNLGDLILYADGGTGVRTSIVDKLSVSRCYFPAMRYLKFYCGEINAFRMYNRVVSLSSLGITKNDVSTGKAELHQDMRGVALRKGMNVIGAVAGNLHKGTVIKVSNKTVTVEFEDYYYGTCRTYSNVLLAYDQEPDQDSK